jgi:hypothetical protein
MGGYPRDGLVGSNPTPAAGLRVNGAVCGLSRRSRVARVDPFRVPGSQRREANIGAGSGMGPVAQPVFKTGAVV